MDDNTYQIARKMREIINFTYYDIRDNKLYFYREDKDPQDYGWKEGQIVDGVLVWTRTHKNPRYFASRI